MYISQFEELACQANYTQGNNETIQFFIRGLSRPILEDIMKVSNESPEQNGMERRSARPHTHTYTMHIRA